MKIAEFSYHEMKRVWLNGHYIARTEESFIKMFEDILAAFKTKPMAEFIRPYMWRPIPGTQPVNSAHLKRTAKRLETKEARLRITLTFYSPISKYGETYESPTFEYVEAAVLKMIWDDVQGTSGPKRSERFPPIASARIELK